MEPLAAGIEALIGIAVVLGIFVGAGTGAASWRARHGLMFWSVLALATYSVASVAVLRGSFLIEVYWGLAPLMLSFLVARLLSGAFCALGLKPKWSRVSALAVAVGASSLYVLALRQDLLWPIFLVLIVDLVLVVITITQVRSESSHGAQQGA